MSLNISSTSVHLKWRTHIDTVIHAQTCSLCLISTYSVIWLNIKHTHEQNKLKNLKKARKIRWEMFSFFTLIVDNHFRFYKNFWSLHSSKVHFFMQIPLFHKRQGWKGNFSGYVSYYYKLIRPYSTSTSTFSWNLNTLQ